ncbi:MAG TPA: hypothetical protein PLO59_07690, partial [Bacteroidia bacterium]|nr:hypothetical protein [Bacteroidia bacterium]
IIYKNCSNCHRPNQSGPFSLLSYSDCRNKAATIKYTVETRFMPPWPADYTYQHYIGEKYLTVAEINRICNWVDDGALMGDSDKIPAPPHFYAHSMLGKPDLVVKATPFFIKGDKHERFIMMKIPFENVADTFIRAIEFVTNNKKLVHHVNGHLLNYLPHQTTNLYKPPFVIDRDTAYEIAESFHNLNLTANDGSEPAFIGSVTNYLPGMETLIFPDGIGTYKVNKHAALLLRDIHYGATTVDTWDASYFNLFYADKPPKRPTIERQLGTLGISQITPPLVVRPNKIDTFRTQATLPVDISLLTINPHMHLIGKSFWAYAVKPNGDTIPIIRIPKWDFRWQYFYTFKTMLKIPKGATIYVVGVYDNTANNPNNPFYPPREIREPVGGNMKTTDEMFQLIMTYLPYQKGDENISLQNP